MTELAKGSDIEINGSRPWDVQVKDERLYSRVLRDGSLGFGEAYMDGWWEAQSIDQLIVKVITGNMERTLRKNPKDFLLLLASIVLNKSNPRRAFQVGKEHYDLGNDLYKAMLDKRMIYTCGYWKNATTLDEAQEAKLDLVCRKAGIKPGDRVLDIGCGWGGFLKFAAEKYGAKGVGITVSEEQAKLARENVKGLDIEIVLQDYRDVNDEQKFDKVISIGMFEQVGYKNMRAFYEVAERNLKDDGIFLLHTIGNNKSVKSTDPWINKYIFPNSMIPSMAQMTKAQEKLFVMEDWHNFGAYYYKTLMAWFANFDAAWEDLKEKYDERFYRMWKYYLLSCAALFRARKMQLWQVVYSKRGLADGYESIR